MKKYWTVTKLAFQRAVEFRMRTIIWIIIDLLVPISLAILFASLAAGRGPIFGYTQGGLILYFLLRSLFATLVSTHANENVAQHIKEGKISNFLVKPINYFWFNLFSNLGWALHKLIFSVPLVILFWIAFGRFISLGSLPRLNPGLLLLILLFAWICDYAFSTVLGLSAFWLIESFALFNFVSAAVLVLNGGIMPLELLPPLLHQLSQLTPFPYLLYFPARYSLGLMSDSEVALSLLILFFWVAGLLIIFRLLWRRGIKRYEGLGL